MQKRSITTEIELMEIKAKYAFIMDELDLVFGSSYLPSTDAKQKLALQMLMEIECALNRGHQEN